MRNPLIVTRSAVAALALFTACAETSSEPVLEAAGEPDAMTVAFSLAANNGRGSEIDRFTNIQFILIYDAESQLLSAHMPSNVCGDGEWNVVDVRRVRTPSPVNTVASTIKDDDSRAAVYRVESPSEASLSGDLSFFGFQNVVDLSAFCAFLTGPNLIAEGTDTEYLDVFRCRLPPASDRHHPGAGRPGLSTDRKLPAQRRRTRPEQPEHVHRGPVQRLADAREIAYHLAGGLQ
jgi:hypothetical protein